MTNDEYQRLVAFLGERFGEVDARISQVDARVEQVRREFGVVAENLESQIRQVAEGVVNAVQVADRYRDELRAEIRADGEQTRALIRVGYAELDRRVRRLEAREPGSNVEYDVEEVVKQRAHPPKSEPGDRRRKMADGAAVGPGAREPGVDALVASSSAADAMRRREEYRGRFRRILDRALGLDDPERWQEGERRGDRRDQPDDRRGLDTVDRSGGRDRTEVKAWVDRIERAFERLERLERAGAGGPDRRGKIDAFERMDRHGLRDGAGKGGGRGKH